MTGQFGKNLLGDRDEHLPTPYGFDGFLGNLEHLNAEEEPENEDSPGDLKLPGGQTFREVDGPRGVLHCESDGKGGQTIQDTGPLTRKRLRTLDEETVAAAQDFITRMHFRTHVKAENRHVGNEEYTGGMIEHDLPVGQLLKLIDDLGIAENTIVQSSTDNGPHDNTWPDAGNTPFRSEENSNWEGANRVP